MKQIDERKQKTKKQKKKNDQKKTALLMKIVFPEF